MERGAARAAGRNTRVDDMEEWRKARERRASSARRPSEEFRGFGEQRQESEYIREQGRNQEMRQDSLPFWEQDDPFGQHGRERQIRRQPDKEERQYRAFQQQPQREIRRRPRQEERQQPRWEESQRPRQDMQQQPRRDERRRFCEAEERRMENDDIPSRRNSRRFPADENRASNTTQRRNSYESARNSRNGLLLLMALLGLLAIAAVIGLNVFRIRTINVKGNESVSGQSIVALSGIAMGENIFKANLTQARKNIESDPLLEVLSISRIFPDGISIEIRQRVPHGVIAYLGSYVVIDEKGFVLDIRESLPAGQYPLITGVEIRPSEKGKPLEGVGDDQLQSMYELLKALYDFQAIQFISEANLGNGGDIRLLTGEGMEIDLGKPTDLGKKAQWIACSIPELRNRGYTGGVLYITGTGNPVYSDVTSGNASHVGGQDSDGADSPADDAGNGDDSSGGAV